jgi:hypothetical protein
MQLCFLIHRITQFSPEKVLSELLLNEKRKVHFILYNLQKQ